MLPALATPTADDGSYNFANDTLTAPNGWSATIPAPVAGSDLYVSTGTFSAEGTATDTTVTWSAAVILVGEGAKGDKGAKGSKGNERH